jgi:hypothetical protein
MINYLTVFKCFPNTVHICRNVRNFNSLHQNQLKLVFKETNNFAIKKRSFRLNSQHLSNKSGDGNVKMKFKRSDLKRLLSLAKPEKWAIAGEFFMIQNHFRCP